MKTSAQAQRGWIEQCQRDGKTSEERTYIKLECLAMFRVCDVRVFIDATLMRHLEDYRKRVGRRYDPVDGRWES